MPGFVSLSNGDLTSEVFLTETDILDDLVGDSLFLWGSNGSGELGDNTVINKSVPVQTVTGGTNWKQVDFGNATTAAIKTDGTLWGWGDNTYGQLGDNTSTRKSSPVQTVAGGNNWKQVSVGVGNLMTTAAIKTDGTLWLWGDNTFGQLGDNTSTKKSSPVQTVAGGTNWKQVSCGDLHTAAIKTDGTLWLWGRNVYGQLGDNSTTPSSSPVQTLAGGTTWKQVSASNHTAAVKTDGTLWLWGKNSFGTLGDNTTTGRSSPVQTVAGGTNWKQVSVGSDHTAAIKTDGTLWMWGYNSLYGQIGDNSTVNKPSPVQTVTGGTNWKQVSCGIYHTSAIKTDGTLWGWGDNAYGQLGDNTTTKKSSPVQTVAGGNNWKQVSGRGYASSAITTGQVT